MQDQESLQNRKIVSIYDGFRRISSYLALPYLTPFYPPDYRFHRAVTRCRIPAIRVLVWTLFSESPTLGETMANIAPIDQDGLGTKVVIGIILN